MMHPIHLPFSEDQLRSHFARVKIGKDCVRTDEAHIEYFRKSIRRHEDFTRSNPDRRGMSITKVRYPCQIEKDERFWIASSMLSISALLYHIWTLSPSCRARIMGRLSHGGSSSLLRGQSSFPEIVPGLAAGPSETKEFHSIRSGLGT